MTDYLKSVYISFLGKPWTKPGMILLITGNMVDCQLCTNPLSAVLQMHLGL
jgi:hypothetical protein